MVDSKRVEINPGEVFLVSDNLVLADSFESCFTMTGKIGMELDQAVYMLTFEGRKNNSSEQTSFATALSIIDAWHLCETMLNQFEWLQQQQNESSEQQ